MSESKSSGLFYHGTSDEVQLGDRVRLKRWFRPDLPGVVCYIPGISPRHSDLEYEGIRQWAIRCDDGSMRPMNYDPDVPGDQPPKNIFLVGRGSGTSLLADE